MRKTLLGLPKAPRTALPPLGVVHIPKLYAEELAQRGKIANGIYTSERLGVTFPVLAGFSATTDVPQAEFAMRRQSPVGLGILMFVPGKQPSAEFFDGLSKGFAQALPKGSSLTSLQDSLVTVAGLPGQRRTWAISGIGQWLRASLIPLCSGQANYVFVQWWGDEKTRDLLDRWLTSVQLIRGGAAPICREISEPPK